MARWSDFDYAEDLRTGDLVYLHDRSQATFRSIRHRMTRVLCDRGLLAQHHGVVEAQRQKILAHCDLEAERAAFARLPYSPHRASIGTRVPFQFIFPFYMDPLTNS